MSGNFLSNNEFIVVTTLTTDSTADSTSAVVDTSNCDGVCFLALRNVAGLSAALITGTTSDASGSTIATIAPTSASHLAVFDLHKPTKRYAKIVAGSSGTGNSVVLAIKYGVRKGIVSQGSTSVAGSTLLVGSS